MAVSVFPAASAASKIENTVIITATGPWVAPAGVSMIEILLVGGGGAGGAAIGAGDTLCGGGGGGGGVVKRSLPVTPGTSYTVTIGAGGARSTATATGGAGASSTFGSLLTALGGGGGGGTSQAGAMSNAFACSGGGQYTTASAGLAGGGGGALPVAMPFSNSTYGIFSYSAGSLQGGKGFSAPYYQLADAGQGGGSLDNLYGGGGGGGSSQSSGGGYAPFFNVGGYNAGRGSTNALGIVATAGVANFGGGGGGGTNYYHAESGGSGVCIIKYWA